MKTVILAAGEGSRMRADGESLPKPLVPLGGLPLLERVIRSAAKAGATEFVVVVGHRGEEIIEAMTPRVTDLEVQWIRHPDWQLGNGSSVLAAKPAVGEEPFLVLMADHLILPATLSRLIASAPPAPESLMAIDRKRGLLADPDDAMKVRLTGDRITEVGKKLDPYDAIDIGAAVCHPRFFEELEAVAVASEGRCAHSAGMLGLAKQELLRAHDIGEDRWEDLDDVRARRAANQILYDSLRKPTDGFLSRLLERRLSLAVTRRLEGTSVTPNQVSAVVVTVGAIAAILFAQPSDAARVAGAIVFWCASFLDGCDGELARLKFLESRLGGWLDLWADNLVHCMVFFGMGVGLFRETGDPLWINVASFAVIGVLLSAGWASWKTFQTSRGGGPLFVSVFGAGEQGSSSGVVATLRWLADAFSRRDFIFGVIFFALLGWIPYFLWAAAIGANLFFVLIVLIEIWERPARA